MGFRTYNPNISQFHPPHPTPAPAPAAALAASRYGFAGGNPVSNIELNGHDWKSTLGSIAVSVGIVAGCIFIAGITEGAGLVLCGIAAGAAGGAAGQGITCAEGEAGGCSPQAFGLSIGFGAASGLIGAGVGGRIAGALSESLPGWVSGAIVGAGSGAVTGGLQGAAGYGLTCTECSWTGLATATAGGAAAGALLGGALGAGFGAAFGSRPEDVALRTAIREGRVEPGAPVNHLNGAMAEELGWQRALARGEVGIKGPGKITEVGPDFITYDPDADVINVWDAKFSKTGRYPATLSRAKLTAWQADIQAAVNDYAGAYAADISNALANGQIAGRIFPYNGAATGWSAR
jgi:hypothetical protein